MRKFLFLFGAILAYLLLCSKSCGSDEKSDSANQEAELTKTKVSIKNEFESDDLSKKSLRAFEVKAKQKLVDFSDYLRIFSDIELDTAFKMQARKMILDLFISDSILINSGLINYSDEKNLTISEFLRIDSSSVSNSIYFTIDSIEIAQPFRRIDDLNYRGRLSFLRLAKSSSTSSDYLVQPKKMEADIIAAKVSKPFGQDTLQVWGVFLGAIK
jgi:hypothetical protein